MSVSVVIPCFREPLERVRRTVESALAVEGVSEVVLVDDGANAIELDDLGVTVIHLPENRGPAAAMNAGVVAAANNIIARIDVGDVFVPETKARQIATVIAGVRASFSPHLDAVSGERFDPPANWRNRIYVDGVFCICTAVFHRSVWEMIDGFDEGLRWGDDWDFSFRVQHAIGWTMFPEVTCEAGAFDGGHTRGADVDPVKRAAKGACTQRAIEKARALSHPEAMAHLRDPRWLRKRGLA